MIAVHFDKAYAQTVLDALRSGRPIPASAADGWSGNAQLMLAGILYAGVLSQGPHTFQVRGLTASDVKAMHPEHAEAVQDMFIRDVVSGIQFVSQMAFDVLDHGYDAKYEPVVAVGLDAKADGEIRIHPVKGVKGR